LKPSLFTPDLSQFKPALSQLITIRRAHTLESRSIGPKVGPLLHQNPEMIQELLFFFLSQKNIPSVKSQAKAKP
jgi:hypothetical protein